MNFVWKDSRYENFYDYLAYNVIFIFIHKNFIKYDKIRKLFRIRL